MSGQRRYSTDAVQLLAVLRLAQACGFSLGEMRHLLHGFPQRSTATERWRELARRKRQELDEQMARLQVMRQYVDRVLQCQCVELANCGVRAAPALKTGRAVRRGNRG